MLQVNRHTYDLNQWTSQVNHEKELMKLRQQSNAATANQALKNAQISSGSSSSITTTQPAVKSKDSQIVLK